MNTKAISCDEILAAGFHREARDNANFCWQKHLGNRVDVVLCDEAGCEPRSGSDLIVHLMHRDERGNETTLMEQQMCFGDLADVVGRFARVRSSTAAVVLKDDKHGDFVAWFEDGSVACGVADFGKDVPRVPQGMKGTDADFIEVIREDYFSKKSPKPADSNHRVPCTVGGTWHNFTADGHCTDCAAVMLHTEEVRDDAGVYKPIEYKPDSAETRVALCETMGVKFTPTVQEMRDALNATLASIRNIMDLQFTTPDDEAAHEALEMAGLDLCLKGGFDVEQVDLAEGTMSLADYCLKATSLECAEATLLAFEAAMTKRNSIFVDVLVLTPAEVQANLDKYQHIADVNEDMTDIKCFHVCKACGWSVVEWNDGHFWTLCCNEDENFETLAAAIEWLRVRF